MFGKFSSINSTTFSGNLSTYTQEVFPEALEMSLKMPSRLHGSNVILLEVLKRFSRGPSEFPKKPS